LFGCSYAKTLRIENLCFELAFLDEINDELFFFFCSFFADNKKLLLFFYLLNLVNLFWLKFTLSFSPYKFRVLNIGDIWFYFATDLLLFLLLCVILFDSLFSGAS